MTDLPEGWAWSTIGEIADVQLGRQRSPQHHNGPHMRPYLRAANITWAGIDLGDVKEMNFDPDEARTFELRIGDILLNEASGSPNEVGKPAVWKEEIAGCCFQNTLLRVRTRGPLTQFLYWYFLSVALTGRFGEAGRGVNIRHLGKQALVAFAIPIPPIGEQERIVLAIESHLSRLEDGVASLSRARQRVAVFDAQTLAFAFSGDYPTAALGEVAAVGSGATPKRGEGRYWDDGNIPWVTSGALHVATVMRPSALITSAALRETSVKLWPAGTVLVAMYGEGKTRGRAAELGIDATCNQACAAIRPDPAVLTSRYLRWFMNSQYERNRRLASGGVQPNLSLGLVKSIRIPLPPVPIQQKIAARLELRAEQLSRLRVELVSGSQRSTTLRRAILGAAFAGKLVSKDPMDEPASVLLDRIRGGRATATSSVESKKAITA